MGLQDIIKTAIGGLAARMADDSAGQMLVASIMVVCAKSDGGISTEENLRMVQLLKRRFGLQAGEALELITRLSENFSGEREISDLLQAANRDLSRSAKEDLMLMVIEVIAADNVKDAREILLLNDLVEKLAIPDDVMERVYAHYFEMRSRGGQKPITPGRD